MDTAQLIENESHGNFLMGAREAASACEAAVSTGGLGDMAVSASAFDGCSRARTNGTLPARVFRKRQIVQRHTSRRERHNHVAKAKFDLLVPIGDLREQAPGCVGASSEGFALRDREREVEGSEVHFWSLPAGALLSTPEVKPAIYPAVMDSTFDLRRDVIVNLVRTKFDNKQAAFAEAAELSATYVSRMLSDPKSKGHKRIGEELAVRLEEKLGLTPGELLDPKTAEREGPPTDAEITDSEWGHLLNLRDMSDEDKDFLREQAAQRSEKFRSIRKQVLAEVGIHGDADAARVTAALGNVPKGGVAPLDANRTVRIRREAPKQLDARGKSSAHSKTIKVK